MFPVTLAESENAKTFFAWMLSPWTMFWRQLTESSFGKVLILTQVKKFAKKTGFRGVMRQDTLYRPLP